MTLKNEKTQVTQFTAHKMSGVTATHTEVVRPITDTTPPDYQAQALSFATASINNLKDGETVSIVFESLNKSNRIDLCKGVTKIQTATEYFSLRSWKGLALSLLIAVPWVFGITRLSSMVFTQDSTSFFNNKS